MKISNDTNKERKEEPELDRDSLNTDEATNAQKSDVPSKQKQGTKNINTKKMLLLAAAVLAALGCYGIVRNLNRPQQPKTAVVKKKKVKKVIHKAKPAARQAQVVARSRQPKLEGSQKQASLIAKQKLTNAFRIMFEYNTHKVTSQQQACAMLKYMNNDCVNTLMPGALLHGNVKPSFTTISHIYKPIDIIQHSDDWHDFTVTVFAKQTFGEHGNDTSYEYKATCDDKGNIVFVCERGHVTINDF